MKAELASNGTHLEACEVILPADAASSSSSSRQFRTPNKLF